MGDITIEVLSKRTEYQEMIDNFKKWNTWQQHYFFCRYTKILDIKLLEILLTDFEPLYHSGYKKSNSKDSGTSLTSVRSTKLRNKRCRIPKERLHHKHVTEDVFKDKTMADYIKKPNPINLKVYSQTMNTEQMKQCFLDQLEYLDGICKGWETYEFIHLIHLLFPFCDKPTLLYLSSCVNKRVFAHDSVLRLPDRAVQIICSYLPAKDLARTAQVSKTWLRYSYRSIGWKVSAMDINHTGVDFSRFSERSEDTLWRRIYLELHDLNKQKITPPRIRFGSIVQTIMPHQNTLGGPQVLRERNSRSGSPDLVKFRFKKSSRPSPMSLSRDNSVASIPSKTAVTAKKPKIVTSLATPVPHSENSSHNVSEAGTLFPSGTNMLKTPSAVPITPSTQGLPSTRSQGISGHLNDNTILDESIPRVASVHASCCLEDEIAYEENFPPKQHSEKHARFIEDVTGYTACISALATTYPLKSVNELVGHKQAVYTFQADSLRLISGCGTGILRIWDIRTGRPVKKTTAHNGAINSLQFDGHKIVTGGWDTFVKIFSVISLRCYSVLTGHTDSVTTVFFNKTHLISTSLDKTLRVYQPSTRESPDKIATSYTCDHVIMGHEAGIIHGDMDQETIYSASLDHTIRLWCAKNYNPIRTIHCGVEIRHFTFDQNLIIASTENKLLLFIDRRKEVPSHHILCGDFAVNYIWLYGSRFITGDVGGLVKEWDLPSGAMLRILHGHLGQVHCVQANKSQIISSSFDQSIKIWYLNQLKSSDNSLE